MKVKRRFTCAVTLSLDAVSFLELELVWTHFIDNRDRQHACDAMLSDTSE